MRSDNPTGDPDNQQGRLEAYLAGFADGEGTFSVGVTRRPDLRYGFQLVPEFRVSQNPERANVLELFQETLACGSIRENDAKRPADRTVVYVVRRRSDLLSSVIPFFHRNPLLSDKRRSIETFETIVTAMAAGRHMDRDGFTRLVELAYTMNFDGTRRKWRLSDVIGN
jgi:LAGLIDADG endonuclease